MKATNNGLPESWLDAYPLSRSSTLVRQLKSLVLPFLVVLVVAFLLLFDFRQFSLRIRLPFPIAQIVLGTILCTIGLLLLAATISWFGIAVAVSSFYFKLSEEAGLVKRFGPEYAEYRKHVPMWIPRIKP